jgi:peroxiredoxin
MSVESTMMSLGTKAPDFRVMDVVTGKWLTPADFEKSKLLLVMFICRHCPYVKHVQDQLARIGSDYVLKNVGIVAISSNDAQAYPDDSPESLKEMALSLKLNFSLCYDPTQEAAKAHQAACTPEFYLFDEQRKLVYRGQLDDSRPKNDIPVTGKDLRDAMNAALSGFAIPSHQKPAIGCSIKWKAGNEPEYFSR